MTPRRHALCLAAIFLAALGLRLGMAEAFVGLSAPPDAHANSDQVDYEAFAHQLARGAGYTLEDGTPTARRPPGTSFVLAPVYAAAGRDWAAGRVWFALLSAATCVLVGMAGTLAFGPIAGLIAAALLALLPEHAYYAAHFLSETPAAFFAAGATALTLLALRKPNLTLHLAAGLCWAAAIYCRPQTLLAVPLVGVVALYPYLREHYRPNHRHRERRLRNRRACVHAFAVQAAVVGLAIAPWFARNAVVMDKATFSTVAGRTFWGAHNDQTFTDPTLMGDWVPTSTLPGSADLPRDEVAHDGAAMQAGVAAVSRHRAKLPEMTLRKVGRALNPVRATPNRLVRIVFSASGLIVLPLAVVGVILARRRRESTAMVVVAVPLIAFAMTTLLFYGSPRFRDAAAPAYALLAALPLAALVERAVARRAETTTHVGPQTEPIGVIQPAHRRAA
ncbi:MAG: glycosyltransferase family 39 protein [Planctomycetota bacterium]